ncbi:TPA: hypothetical protein N0F65_010849 [Lagenidium giganteum]|uniref:Uncharacterized protein n=1 Tax=Lagenidium giganteum TaxID=4803 RepID=A0AAV2Z747_9STRA|nr:TPA: hypothetical protein N0F65_010849 [Lagenidium giganteum]
MEVDFDDGSLSLELSALLGVRRDSCESPPPNAPPQENPRASPPLEKGKRKPTYLVRKEERDELLKQIDSLQRQLAYLEHRVVPVRPIGKDANSDSEGDEGVVKMTEHDPLYKAAIANASLQSAVRMHHVMLANMQSQMSEAIPLHTRIQLGTDMEQRCATLVALKPKKVAIAYQLLRERTRFLDDSKMYSSQDQYISIDGNNCLNSFDITPLPRARSVQHVLEALEFVVQNIDLALADKQGQLTVSESLDQLRPDITHSRYVSRLRECAEQEVQLVIFREYDAEKNVGLVVIDSVDQDPLHPYNPDTRIRRDISQVVLISTSQKQPELVTVQRMDFTVVHKPKMSELMPAFKEVSDSSPVGARLILRTLQDVLNSTV